MGFFLFTSHKITDFDYTDLFMCWVLSLKRCFHIPLPKHWVIVLVIPRIFHLLSYHCVSLIRTLMGCINYSMLFTINYREAAHFLFSWTQSKQQDLLPHTANLFNFTVYLSSILRWQTQLPLISQFVLIQKRRDIFSHSHNRLMQHIKNDAGENCFRLSLYKTLALLK